MEQLHSSTNTMWQKKTASQSDKAVRTAPMSLSNRWKLHCTFTCWLKVTLMQVGRVSSKSVKCCRKRSTISTTFVHGVHGCEGQKAEKAVYYKVEVQIVKHNYLFHYECIWWWRSDWQLLIRVDAMWFMGFSSGDTRRFSDKPPCFCSADERTLYINATQEANACLMSQHSNSMTAILSRIGKYPRVFIFFILFRWNKNGELELSTHVTLMNLGALMEGPKQKVSPMDLYVHVVDKENTCWVVTCELPITA